MSDEQNAASNEENFDLLLDVPLRVSIELGRTKMKIQDLLEVGQGAVVELDRLAGEPVDILVNGSPVAKGEVVVANDHYAVRVVSINGPTERLEALK